MQGGNTSLRYYNLLRNHTSYVNNTRQNLQEILYWRHYGYNYTTYYVTTRIYVAQYTFATYPHN